MRRRASAKAALPQSGGDTKTLQWKQPEARRTTNKSNTTYHKQWWQGARVFCFCPRSALQRPMVAQPLDGAAPQIAPALHPRVKPALVRRRKRQQPAHPRQVRVNLLVRSTPALLTAQISMNVGVRRPPLRGPPVALLLNDRAAGAQHCGRGKLSGQNCCGGQTASNCQSNDERPNLNM